MTEADAKLLNTAERHEFQKALAYGKTRQGSFENSMLHFDHPLPGGGRILEPSDRGASAAEIYRMLEPTPLWTTLWKRSAAKLPRTGKKVLAALMEDWRSRPAAKIAGVDHKTVDSWKKIFKVHFAQCFRAYKPNLTR